MGRHDDSRRSGLWWVAPTALVALLVVLGGIAWANWPRADEPAGRDRADGPAATSAPATATATPCEEPAEVRVTTTPDLAPVLAEVAAGIEEEACATYVVTAAPAAETAAQLTVATATGPHVWVPDSPVWAERTAAARGEALEVGPVLATSPVVIALPRAMTEELGGAQPWQTFLTGGVDLLMADPEESTASLLALVSAGEVLGGTPEGEQALGRATIVLSRQETTEDELFDRADSPDAVAFPASEQRLFRHLADNPGAPLVAVVPAEGTGSFAFPFVRVAAAPGPAVAALEEALTGPAGRAAFAAAGFRDADGGGSPGVPGVPEDTEPRPDPPAAAVEAALASWRTVAVDMRMLAVIDISGSMLDDAGGRTRIELAAGAAQVAMQQFPPTSQVGLWAFSTDHGEGRDWTELVPVARIDSPAGDGTHRDALLAAAQSLPARADGDTGLYDTVLAAYRTVQDTYEPGFVNSVVLLTDGKNEDDDGISFDQLLAELQAVADPDRPVPVITVGMGPGTDETELRVISAQTGGRSYLAQDPADIGTVFVDALLNRPRR